MEPVLARYDTSKLVTRDWKFYTHDTADHHEICLGPRRMFVDYDCYIDLETSVQDEVLRVANMLISKFSELNQKNIVIFNSSGFAEHDDKPANKISLHVIVKDLVMTHSDCQRMQKDNFPQCDPGVYNFMQNLRMPNSTKSGSIPRYKRIIYGGPLSRDCFVQVDVPKVHSWLDLKALMPARTVAIGSSNDTYPELMGFFATRPGTNTLTRLQRGYCACCERHHDNENISILRGQVFCFRSKIKCDYAKYVDALKD